MAYKYSQNSILQLKNASGLTRNLLCQKTLPNTHSSYLAATKDIHKDGQKSTVPYMEVRALSWPTKWHSDFQKFETVQFPFLAFL